MATATLDLNKAVDKQVKTVEGAKSAHGIARSMTNFAQKHELPAPAIDIKGTPEAAREAALTFLAQHRTEDAPEEVNGGTENGADTNSEDASSGYDGLE